MPPVGAGHARDTGSGIRLAWSKPSTHEIFTLAQKLRQIAILLRISAVNYPDQSDAIDSGTKAGDCALLIRWQGRLKIAG